MAMVAKMDRMEEVEVEGGEEKVAAGGERQRLDEGEKAVLIFDLLIRIAPVPTGIPDLEGGPCPGIPENAPCFIYKFRYYL